METIKENQIVIIANLLRLIDKTEQMVQIHGVNDSMGKQYAYKKMRLTQKLEKLLNEFGLNATIATDFQKAS